MMKRLFILFTIFLSYASTTLQAQDNLPQNFSISLGGGVTLPRVEGNRNDFFSKNGDRAGYNLMTEGRYYFMPNFALGLQYDYLRVARLRIKCTSIIYTPILLTATCGVREIKEHFFHSA